MNRLAKSIWFSTTHEMVGIAMFFLLLLVFLSVVTSHTSSTITAKTTSIENSVDEWFTSNWDKVNEQLQAWWNVWQYVELCHIWWWDLEERSTLRISESEVAIHRDTHEGDYLGPCKEEHINEYDVLNTLDYVSQWYVYDETSGEIIAWWRITVQGDWIITMIKDGSDGEYWFSIENASGRYTLVVTYPETYEASRLCVGQYSPVFDPTSLGIWVVNIGADRDTKHLSFISSYECTLFYLVFDVVPWDPFIFGNNIPVRKIGGRKYIESLTNLKGVKK